MHAVSVIDCTNPITFDVSRVRSFPDTPEGRDEARKLFEEWVNEACSDEDRYTEEEMEAAWDEGRAFFGEGFIAVVFGI